MRQKTIWYLLASLVLTALLAFLGIVLNRPYPQLASGQSPDSVTLTYGAALTGWEQTAPGQWRFRFQNLPSGDDALVLCLSNLTETASSPLLQPLDEHNEFFLLASDTDGPVELTIASRDVPRGWVLRPRRARMWIILRNNLQLVALVSFATMGIALLALFYYKPQQELGYFLLYVLVLLLWGISVSLTPSSTSSLLSILHRLYFSFAVALPFWLSLALTKSSLPRNRRSYILSLIGSVLFLVLSLSSQNALRTLVLLAGMLAVFPVLTSALARGNRAALFLLAGHTITTGLRVLVLLPSLRRPWFIESFPFYMIRCARIYDLPFTLCCLIFVCRRFAMQFDRTEQLAQELDQRVAQRTQALQEETDARKSMMLNIFHDLRSPLFAVSSGLEILSDSPEMLPSLLPVLRQRIEFVRGLTEDLFLAAKLEQKQIMLNEEPVLLDETAQAVCTACQTEADRKGVCLTIQMQDALPVWGDSLRLQQIVQNLVTNAIHYTPQGGSVRLCCSAAGDKALVSVTDTGCGIAPEDQSAVFDRYFHTTANTKHDSTGLGLTIAQELAHLHHGEITLQSTLGKGSCFTLQLPLLKQE